MVRTIIKRDGRTAEFHQEKIASAVEKAFAACAAMQDRAVADEIAAKVVAKIDEGAIEGTPTVEGVQDLVEETLIESGFVQTAKSYILYRAERNRVRDVNSRLIQTLKDITFSKASDSDMKRENANIDADTAMGTMLKYGSESAKQFYEMCVIDPRYAKAHREGDIHIHDMDFYTLTTTCCQIELSKASDSDMKRENANIDADTAMGTMLKYGSESAKQFYEMCVIDPRYAKAHREGDIHIHDMDFYTLTTTCCQIELRKLFKGGFSTGHGVLREPNDIQSYAALACIAIQSNQNDQHGGQSVCDFDYGLAEGVRKTYRRLFKKHIAEACDLLTDIEDDRGFTEGLLERIEGETGKIATLEMDPAFREALVAGMREAGLDDQLIERIIGYAEKNASRDTDRSTFQAMEALVHNLNTMHSRAGAQTPFSSVNYGMDTSPEGRMVIKNMLLATEEGLGSGETPIFPVQIFRVKEGVNYNPEDPNYDLFKLAMHCSAKRLFPNFSFLDAPFNLQYYKGTPETEIAYMGCRTRVMGNVFDPEREVTPGRGNLSFTSINLPRLAIRAKGDLDLFFDLLDSKLQLVTGQLDERFEIQARKHVYNAPFLMGQGVWIDSEKLKPTDEQREVLKHGTLTTGFIGLAECLVALTGKHHGESPESQRLGEKLKPTDEQREVLKHGTLTTGFIGLAECLVALTGKHHGESPESQRLGLEIIGHMRSYCDRVSRERGMNYTLIATPAEGLSGRFVRIDRERYGVIPGVTDRDYYTNGFHVPVYYDISAFDKIAIEAPYHALTNGGHISYIELDGDPTDNLEAFESVIRYMKECGMGYGSVNHPVDRDPICGYNGPDRQPRGVRVGHPLHEGVRHGLRFGEPSGRPRPHLRLQRHHRGRVPEMRPH